MLSENGEHLSRLAKDLGHFLVKHWDADPTVIEPSLMTLRSGGRVEHAFFAHERLQRNLPQQFKDPATVYSAFQELVGASFIVGPSDRHRLSDQLRRAAYCNFFTPEQPFLSEKLREPVKIAARALSWEIYTDQIPDVFFCLVEFNTETISLETTSGESLNHSGSIFGDSFISQLEVVRELERANLIDAQVGPQGIGWAKMRIRVRPPLHDAVASNFEIYRPSNATMTVQNMFVKVDKAYITGLKSDPDQLAEALEQRLLPFLQKNLGLDTLAINMLHQEIAELREAVSADQVRSATDKFFTTFGRVADTAAILALMTQVITG